MLKAAVAEANFEFISIHPTLCSTFACSEQEDFFLLEEYQYGPQQTLFQPNAQNLISQNDFNLSLTEPLELDKTGC